VREVASGFNTVADVLPPEPPIEARDAAGVVEFDEVAGTLAGVSIVSTVRVEAVGATWSGSPRRRAWRSSRLSIPELAQVSG